MVEGIIALLAALAALIPYFINRSTVKKETHDNLAQAEVDEFGAGMDRVDKLQPVPKPPAAP